MMFQDGFIKTAKYRNADKSFVKGLMVGVPTGFAGSALMGASYSQLLKDRKKKTRA